MLNHIKSLPARHRTDSSIWRAGQAGAYGGKPTSYYPPLPIPNLTGFQNLLGLFCPLLIANCLSAKGRIRLFVFLLVGGLLLPLPSPAQQFLLPKITTFTPKQYNAHYQIYCLAADHNGNIWFGTGDKLLLYDGSGFEHIEVGSGKSVFSLDIDSAGRVFIGCQGDFGYVSPPSFPPIRGEVKPAPLGAGVWQFHSLLHLIPDSLKDFNIIWKTHVLSASARGGSASGRKNRVVFNGYKYLFLYAPESNTIRTLFPKKKFYNSYKINEKIWIKEKATGLFALEDDSLQFIQGSDYFKDIGVNSILPYSKGASGSNGYLVITGKDGLYNFHPGISEIQHSTLFTPLPPEGGESKSPSGLSRLTRGDLGVNNHSTFTSPFASGIKEALSESKVNCAILLDSAANPFGASLALGTRLNGIFFLNSTGSMLLHLNQKNGLPSNSIWNLSLDRQINLWAATDNGIAQIQTGAAWTLTPEGEEFQGAILSIAKFNEKLWFATSQGLYYLSGGAAAAAWRSFEPIKGQCFEMTGNKEFLLVAAANSGVQKIYAENRQELLTTLPPRIGRDMPEGGENKSPDVSGDFPPEADPPLVEGVSYHSSQISKYTAYSIAFVVRQRTDPPLAENLSDYIVFGGREGIGVISNSGTEGKEAAHHQPLPVRQAGFPKGRGKEVEMIKTPEEIQSVKAYYRNDTVTVWGGMQTRGVCRLMIPFTGNPTGGYGAGVETHNNASLLFTVYDTTHGLPEGAIGIFTLEHSIVFGTDKGLYKFENNRFVPDCSLDTLFCNGSRQVYRLAKEENGEIWVMDARGGQIKHLIPNDDGVNAPFRIDSAAFSGVDIGGIRAIFPDGDLCWLGGENGVVCYNKKVAWTEMVLYKAQIRNVSVKRGGEKDSVLFGGALLGGEQPPLGELPYQNNNITFTYAAPFYDNTEKIEYSYRLEGQEKEWSQWSKERKKEYGNLWEGKYIFKVKARNVYSVESAVAAYEFRVLAPWYRAWWAYSVYGLMAIMVMWFIVWLNSRRLLSYAKMLKQKVDEATTEIRKQKEVVEEQKKVVEEQKKVVEEAHKNTMESIEYASMIQRTVLTTDEYMQKVLSPKTLETKNLTGFSAIGGSALGGENLLGLQSGYFLLFMPRDIVSGDFYWCYSPPPSPLKGEEESSKVIFAVCDCTGHGVPGAFMSMMCINLLDETVIERGITSPGEILDELKKNIVNKTWRKESHEGGKDGMDCAICVWEKPTPDPSHSPNGRIRPLAEREGKNAGALSFAGANNPLYVARRGASGAAELIEIPADSMPVGYEEGKEKPFTTQRVALEKGDMLYIFSDGFQTQLGGAKGKKFMRNRFRELLCEISGKPLEEQKEILGRTMEVWVGEGEQTDDITVMGVRI